MSQENKGKNLCDGPWQAPFIDTPIDTTVTIPGSKSLTNRYFVLAALCAKTTHIHKPLIARDTILMARALQKLGVDVDLGENVTRITPRPLGGGKISVGLAGTVMRFIPALSMLATEHVHIDGDAGARQRPMGAIVQGLRQLGVHVEAENNNAGEATLPLDVYGTGEVEGGVVTVDASASSQFISALMLVAPATRTGIDIRHTGAHIPSAPHLEMTVEVLRQAGINVDTEGNSNSSAPSRWVVHPGTPALGDITVEPDLSNAGPFLAAAMLTGGTVRIPDFPEHTTQAGAFYREIFESMGATCTHDGNTLTLQGSSEIRGIDRDMHDVGELVPTVAAVCAYAQTPSALRNIGQLRGHETDRLVALERELRAVGCGAEILGDDLHITPAPLHGACLHTYNDHRMATFAAILGLRTPGIEVENIATTAKTFPQFADMWNAMAHGEREVTPASVDIAQTESTL